MTLLMLVFLINQGKTYMVDQPNSCVFEHAEYEVALRFGPSGGVLSYFGIGLLDRFAFGLSLGAANLIGEENPRFYPHPGIQIKAQLLGGDVIYPEWALGFDNQGFGDYDHGEERYSIKSKGLYSCFGKAIGFGAGEFYLGMGINYTLERSDDRSLDIFFSQSLKFIDQFAIITDYDPAFNDPRCDAGGYLNLALRINLAESVAFEFGLRDILANGSEELNRVIKLAYVGSF